MTHLLMLLPNNNQDKDYHLLKEVAVVVEVEVEEAEVVRHLRLLARFWRGFVDT